MINMQRPHLPELRELETEAEAGVENWSSWANARLENSHCLVRAHRRTLVPLFVSFADG